MTTHRHPGESFVRSDLQAEHRALKEQTDDELRREHDRLHNQGEPKEEHRQHIRKLRTKIEELERHVERLESWRDVNLKPEHR